MKTYRFKIGGNDYNVEIHSVEGNNACVTVNGTQYQVEIDNPSAAPLQQKTAPVQSEVPSASAKPPVSAGSKTITSPLPGVIIDIKVKVGDTVKTGTEVAVLEAMKMENSIEATSDGIVTSVNVSKGDSVLEGAPIITIG